VSLDVPGSRIAIFPPPYSDLAPIMHALAIAEPPDGAAVVWFLQDATTQQPEYDLLRERSPALPLFVLLPPARDIRATLPLLHRVPSLRPRAVLPGPGLGSPVHLRELLALPPRGIADVLVEHLAWRGLLTDRVATREVRRIIELAPDVNSISGLARRMYTSRRTLGRHFASLGLPVPSHWLQFARLFHVALQIQANPGAIFRIATRAGYPDGFTLSNQMKRLIGCRPTHVRRCLGWEWIVEAWLRMESARGALTLRSRRARLPG
jgi:AraC-like DNA-binding protein